MTTRLDLALQKHPAHAEGIRLLAERDPSGKLKYLDWGAKILASGQALAPEIADVTELFHQFNGHRLKVDRVQTDIYSYHPQDLATLRDILFKIKQAQDRKRKKRERLYRIEGSLEADLVYDGPDLIVRHIKNKQASVHYGHQTKWCIAMLREGYFEDYEANNATFFFFERKSPVGDEFDKVALMVPRSGHKGMMADGFTSVDRRVDMMVLAKVYGSRVFDIFRQIYECSENYPGSATFCVYRGDATREQIEAVVASINQSRNPYELESLLEAICCNDATPLETLVEIERRASALSKAAFRRVMRRHLRRRWVRKGQHSTKELERVISAALVVHPNVPTELRDQLIKKLRKQHIKIDQIRRVNEGDHVGVQYREPIRLRRHVRHRRRKFTLTQLRRRLVRFENTVIRTRKAIEKKAAANEKKAAKRNVAAVINGKKRKV